MIDEALIKLLKQLHSAELRGDIVDNVRARIFKHVSPENRTSIARRMPLTWLLAPAGAALALLLVVANQLPMNSAYEDSITAIADASLAVEQLRRTPNVETVATLKDKTEQARFVLASLKLEGVPGMYTQAQCLNAHVIYDRYLDSIDTYLSQQIPLTNDSEVRAAYEDLQSFAKKIHAETEQRIDMYPNERR